MSYLRRQQQQDFERRIRFHIESILFYLGTMPEDRRDLWMELLFDQLQEAGFLEPVKIVSKVLQMGAVSCRHGDNPNECISCRMLASRPSKKQKRRT